MVVEKRKFVEKNIPKNLNNIKILKKEKWLSGLKR